MTIIEGETLVTGAQVAQEIEAWKRLKHIEQLIEGMWIRRSVDYLLGLKSSWARGEDSLVEDFETKLRELVLKKLKEQDINFLVWVYANLGESPSDKYLRWIVLDVIVAQNPRNWLVLTPLLLAKTKPQYQAQWSTLNWANSPENRVFVDEVNALFRKIAWDIRGERN
jgi:hypothetical protein